LSVHPTPAELDAVLQGGLPPERRKAVFTHLLSGCESCRDIVARGRRSLRVPLPLSSQEDDAYEAAIDRAFETALRLERRMRRAHSRSEDAALLDAGGPVIVTDDGDPHLPDVDQFQSLLARSWAVRHENPRAMVSLARCALVVAEALDPRAHGAQRVADFQARAWAELGNALRTADDLDEAAIAFEKAFDCLFQGTGDEMLEARLRDLRASFHGARRKFDRAFQELDAVQFLYRRLGDDHLAGRALVKKAIYVHYAGQSEEAIAINEEAMARIDESREPGLASVAVHNQLWFLVACGRLAEAKSFLVTDRARLREVGHVLGIKLRWLEGQIDAGLGDWENAEKALLEARMALEQAGMVFHAALAALDLALLRMRQGRLRETAGLVEEAVGVFTALRIPREALGAVLLLEQAFAMRKATVTLLESAVDFLRRSESDPDARYVPRFD
jgi:tetratricopeptide (TPR) repeat protein